MTERIVYLTKVRETKGAVLYAEVDSTGLELDHKNPKSAVGTVYFRKHFFEGGITERLKMIVKIPD